MKTVVFIGSKYFGEKNDAGALAKHVEIALGAEYQIRHYNFEDLLVCISNAQRSITCGSDGYDMKDAELVIAFNWYPSRRRGLRDVAFTLGLYLQEHGKQFWNSEMSMQRSTTKLSATWLLSVYGVPIPDTVFSLNHQTLACCHTGRPMILKDIAASRGRDNFVVHTQQEVLDVLGKSMDGQFVLQEFIPNDFDIRLICIGGKPQLAIKRQRTTQNTHLNNTSQGGEAQLLPLDAVPQSVREEARRICLGMKRELAGIDYIVSNASSGRYVCLEVNAIPQLSSGTFLDEKYQAFSQGIRQALGKE